MKKFVAIGLTGLALSFSNASADDIFKGVKGPTNMQADIRVVRSVSDNGTCSLVPTCIGKYWDGDKIGKWAFVSIPYKFIQTKDSSLNGIGDVTIGGGPRGVINNFHLLPYYAEVLPMGDTKTKPPLGSGRYETKIGCFATYLTDNKNFDIDGSYDYNFSRHETSFGAVTGIKLSNRFRTAGGFTYFDGRDKSSATLRSVSRYTVSKNLHFELIGDYGLTARNVPRTNILTCITRYNF